MITKEALRPYSFCRLATFVVVLLYSWCSARARAKRAGRVFLSICPLRRTTVFHDTGCLFANGTTFLGNRHGQWKQLHADAPLYELPRCVFGSQLFGSAFIQVPPPATLTLGGVPRFTFGTVNTASCGSTGRPASRM